MLAFGSRILGMYVDWLWFGEVGFRGVFWTRIWAQLLLGLVAFVLFFVVIWANVELARRLAPDFRADIDGTLLEPRSPAVRRWVGIGAAVVCVIVAFIAAVSVSGSWQRVLLYFNQASWGEKDPIFGRDISFYVFSVPFWQGILSFVLAALIVVAHPGRHRAPHHGRHRHQAEAGQGCAGRRRRGAASPFARAQQAPHRSSRRSTSSSAAARSRTSPRCWRRSSSSSPSASCSRAGTCCTRRPGRCTAPATRTCTSACRSPT